MKRKQTLANLKKQCWDLFSEYVRRSAADEGGTVECYTCRKLFHWKEIQAGHFVGGRSGSVLLNEEVVRCQCVQCNVFLRGNYQAYTLRMIDEVGRDKVNELLALKHRVKKWSRAELEWFKDYYKERLLNLSGER